MYPRHVFFACGGTLGHSDVLVGPPVFLLGVGKKVISLQVPVGLLIFGPNCCTRAIIITFLLYIKSTGACMSCVFLILTYFYCRFDLP